jgi:DNA primase
MPKPHRKYLLRRGFNPDAIISKYGVGGCYNTGDRRYRMRIIIPIYMEDKLVSFTARTIVDAQPKYRGPNDEDAAMPGRAILYGLDNVKYGIAALVEGPTDVWRIGDGAIAMMRTRFTEEQLTHIPRSGIHTVYVIYDAGAEKLGEELASRVSKLVNKTVYVPLDGQDPATLNPAELHQIHAWLRGA